ncbi:MAG: dephospho-CoA kinase [Acidaminococcaceae bacterium]|nr:dephospho-CoA kinase [Acidaminococcaceae bacterium]
MIIIGLAGGIGIGKSTTAAYLRSLGIPVFNATGAAKSVAVSKGSESLQKIAQLLGSESILPNGELNRPWVAEKVFHDKALLKQFEAILQEQVWNDVQAFLAFQKECGAKVVFLDLPLMIERGWHTIANSVWLIAAPKELRIQRAIQRDKGLTPETVVQRINAQPSLEELKKYAHVIIDNSGDFEHTKVQLLEQLRKVELGL